MTKKGIKLVALMVGLLIAAPSLLRSESDYDFTLKNATGYDIAAVFVAPSNSDDWGDDVMGNHVLGNGQSVKIEFHPKAHAKSWDMKIDWNEPGYPDVVWKNLDLASINKLTLKYNRKTDQTSASFE